MEISYNPMKVTKETFYGTVEFSTAVFDLDGTNLEEGVEVRINDELVGELVGESLSRFEEMSDEEVEKFVEDKEYV